MEDLRVAASLATPVEADAPEGLERSSDGPSFSTLIAGVLSEANRRVNEAEHQARELAEGRGGIVETILSLNKADLSLRFALELRDRLMEAYRDITHMQM